jgi:general secretion pathway protein J
MRSRAFTLLEMLVALAVFAVIGVMASQILASMVDLAAATKTRSEQFADLQRAIFIVGRDVEQLTQRGVRDEDGETLDAVLVGDGLLVELTRHGWRNATGAARSEVQRVAYALAGDDLVRLYWPVLDRAPDTVPVAQRLLGGVRDAQFIVHDDLEQQHAFWPADAAEGEEEEPAGQLAGIELRLQHGVYGRIEKLWLTAGTADFLHKEGKGEGEGEDDDPPQDQLEDQDEAADPDVPLDRADDR